jgi:hydrogenase maturation protease
VTAPPTPPPPLVIGMGNALRGDDACGLEVAARLRRAAPSELRVLDWSVDGIGLLDAWEGEPFVVVIDAVRSGAPPGAIVRIDAGAGPLPASLSTPSTHSVSLAHAVELARSLGKLPAHLVIYGIEGADFRVGAPMGAAVVRAVAVLSARLVAELGQRRGTAPAPGGAGAIDA